eukprot:3816731-Prymnesium_polylepis.1
MVDSEVRGCSSDYGGAIHVVGGTVVAAHTMFNGNKAGIAGGAIYVDGGEMVLSDRTELRNNHALLGDAAHLTERGSLAYRLPTPLAHWVFIADRGDISRLSPGSIDGDFPFPCAPGLVGISNASSDQSGPQCSGSCTKGFFCPLATHSPKACTLGDYCVTGSPAPVNCPSGTMGQRRSLGSADDCESCPPGTSCASGSTFATPCSTGWHAPNASSTTCTACSAGTYQDQEGQTQCKICKNGHYCPVATGSARPCPAGTYSDALGLSAEQDCEPCTLGFYCPEASTAPVGCAKGTYGSGTRLGDAAFCTTCLPPTTSLVGSASCTICLSSYYKVDTSSISSTLFDCKPCLTGGSSCAEGTTLANVELQPGRWRLSSISEQVVKCITVSASLAAGSGNATSGAPSHGEWSPCKGGSEPGVDGDGYCEAGYFGPR